MGSREPPRDLDSYLDQIEALLDAEEIARARKELARAKRAFPGSVDLLEWEAAILGIESRPTEALKLLEDVLAREPDRPFARRERSSVLLDLGRFSEAAKALRELLAEGRGVWEDEERAGILYDLGLCLDREGRLDEADASFRKAERLAPEGFPAPPRLASAEFDAIVAQALADVPARFQPYLDQVAVVVEDYPSSPHDDPFLLGLYDGVPRTERSVEGHGSLDRIFVFKRNHELQYPDVGELREEVRKTVVHELAHHFGLDEHEMGEYA